ncbi:hypothetical protein AAK943_03950 [Emergencia timonensis]|uniref:hypothetical protein n=1 Tax=Emergencia timonensis TaxID=1776384 RepID=UPI000833229A|nr:hypothetical protein [Emergencia timonensis]
MKSKKSFCNLSAVLVSRNLKQFWLIPFAAFLAYFIRGILPLIVKSSSYETLRYLTNDVLSNHDYVYLGVLMVLPICASIAVFSYLHGNAPATAMHAMPFSRKKLYRSSVVSGMIMIVLPILLIGLCYAVLLRGDVYDLAPEILPSWIFRTFVSTFFVYAVSTFAAVVAGSVVTHILLAMFFNGLLPITIYLVNRFMSAFLFGYSNSPLASYIFSPVSFERNNYISILYDGYTMLTYLAYLLVAFLLIWCSAAAYRRLPLEKEGNATVITWLGEIICVLFAFVATIIFDFFIISWGGEIINLPLLLIGSLIGSFLFYIVARMILEKSLAVFRLAALKKYMAVLAALVLFFGLTVFDLTGYTTKVPEAGTIESIALDDPFPLIGMPEYLSDNEVVLTKEENIVNLTNFHRLLVKNKSYLTKETENTYFFEISYHLKDGNEIRRFYSVPLENKLGLIDAYRKIYESSEYKQSALTSIQNEQASDFQLLDKTGEKLIMKLPDSFGDKFKTALIQDVEGMTLEDAMVIQTDSYQYTLQYKAFYPGVQSEKEEKMFNVYAEIYPHINKLLAKEL